MSKIHTEFMNHSIEKIILVVCSFYTHAHYEYSSECVFTVQNWQNLCKIA